MTTLFSAPPKPKPPPAPPTPDNSAATMDAAAEAERKARGRASTMLTGGLGLNDSPTLARNTLLGT